MHTLDQGLDALQRVMETAQTLDEDPLPIEESESSTRLHLIDPILQEVLGWPGALIRAEVPSGGGRLDYVLHDPGQICWMVVEAKKRDVSLFPLSPARREGAYKLNNPFLRGTLSIIQGQMYPYLGRFQPAYGVVTNGEQWVVFLNHLRPQGVALEVSKALVFASLRDVEERFDLFYNALSFSHREARYLVGQLSEALPGYVMSPRGWPVVGADEVRRISFQNRAGFYQDLERAARAAFRPLLEDPEALVQCFVESRESAAADTRLQRVASELQEHLRDAAEYPGEVRAELEGRSDAEDEGAPLDEEELIALRGQGFLARILGEPGAGKSTFLRRLFHHTLEDLRARFALVWLDLRSHHPFTPDDADRVVIERLYTFLQDAESQAPQRAQEVAAARWERLAAAQGLTGGAPTEVGAAWRRFEEQARELVSRSPRALVEALAAAVVALGCLPVFVLDDLDGSAEEARAAMLWASSRHRSTFALTVIAVQDTTLWSLRRQRQDPLSPGEAEPFWLHRPAAEAIIQKRCEYIRHVLQSQASPGRSTRTRLGSRHRWTVSADELVRVVSAVLLDEAEINAWIGELGNLEAVDILDICRGVLLSPRLRAEDLFRAQNAAQPPPLRHRVLKALIAPMAEQYVYQPDSRVISILGIRDARGWAPLLPARVLAWLEAREGAASSQERGVDPLAGFVAAQALVDRLSAALQAPAALLWLTLERLHLHKLIATWRPDVGVEFLREERVQITPRGRLHLKWLREEPTWLRLMAEVEPIPDEAARVALRTRWDEFIQRSSAEDRTREMNAAEGEFNRAFVTYLLDELRRVSPTPPSPEMEPLRGLEHQLRQRWCPDVV